MGRRPQTRTLREIGIRRELEAWKRTRTMSEWHVSASESEGEERSERKPENGVLELGGLKIPADRMVDLLQVANDVI